MTHAPTPNPLAGRSLRAPVLWGVVWGVIQAGAPLGFWWLDPATVYALSLALIAAVYIGFAVADGRPTVIAVEAAVAAVFVIVAAAGVTGPAWLLVASFTAHGVKDLVTGALALVVGLFFAVSIGAFFATNVNDFRQFGRCLDGARGDQAREACAQQLERNLDR